MSWSRPTFAVLFEQGLGKTWVALATAERLVEAGEIDGLFVLAPNGVHINWTRHELPEHFGLDYVSIDWSSQRSRSKTFERRWDETLDADFAVLSMNVEALSSGDRASEHARAFLKRRRCLMVVDESSRVKTPGSRRTKRVVNLGKLAPFRRIMTGTPVTQSPFDVFSQFKFLDTDILGFTSYHAFRHRFGVFTTEMARRDGRTWQYEELVKYVRLDELQRLVAGHSFRRTKAECLDLPEKIRQRRVVELTPTQRRLYDTMMQDGYIEIPEEGIEYLAPLAITRLLRCQQITGGFLPTISSPTWDGCDEDGALWSGDADGRRPSNSQKVEWTPVKGKNPKLEACLDEVDAAATKTIVWARFRAEIAVIVAALKKTLGRDAVVEMHGGVTGAGRAEAVDRFQEDDRCRVLVGQQQSGIGVTLTAAELVVYYSNSFSFEQRSQSEDRAHRIGTTHPVVYVDIEGQDTVDEDIRNVLLRSKRLADIVTGDAKRSGGDK